MTLNGIDVASYQAGLNLVDLKNQNSNLDFVIIKVSEANNYINPEADRHYQQAKEANLLRGHYHFARPGDPIEQANFFVNNSKNYFNDSIPFLDWEANAIDLGVNWAKKWLDEVYKLTGVRPIIYMSKSVTNQFDWSSVSQDYALWTAQYASMEEINGFLNENDIWTDNNPFGSWGYTTIYQYTSNLRLNGWSAGLDGNIAYMTKEAWLKFQNSSKNNEKPIEPEYQPRFKNRFNEGDHVRVTDIAEWTATGQNINEYRGKVVYITKVIKKQYDASEYVYNVKTVNNDVEINEIAEQDLNGLEVK